MQLPLSALTALETLVNPLLRKAVAQGGATAITWQKLQDTCVEIRVQPWGARLLLHVTADGLYFYRQGEDTPDAWMEATPQAYIKMATRPDAASVMFSPEVKVGGDTHKLELLQQLLSGLGLDAVELISRVTGPLPLAGLQAGFSQLTGFMQRFGGSAMQDAREYLDEESGLLPGQNSLHLLEDALEELRLDVDRLEARIRLQEQMVKKAGED
ncbi:MAG: SCP2 sterol-binding domain-containing protein [Marinospirillum sp.]|uniref:ubiquinone biosynthesis accessory factor UbiJ n=1 Tax=Marinospirillum sp. TaxID=2183934 RepID=UPI0019ED85DD|nr:SCP2 sterol-binding domain-containing protein [Marinospirillum sp.]MBE0506505.1 SCP2 sterol-binding domain-containing protein [Marinospirillum sp.]